MKTQISTSLFYVIVLMLCACSENETKTKEILLQSNYHQIEDIISIADCDSPFGKYITEVHSLNDGSCYFNQKFSDSDSPFIVKLDSKNKGYLVNEQNVILDTLDPGDVEMIRGHEIHKMSINPTFFFKNITFEEQINFLENKHELYLGKDKLDNRVKIFYNRTKKIISKIELLNSKDTTQSIEIVYTKWTNSKFGQMAKAVKIIQAKKDTFNFNFKTLKVIDKTGEHIL